MCNHFTLFLCLGETEKEALDGRIHLSNRCTKIMLNKRQFASHRLRVSCRCRSEALEEWKTLAGSPVGMATVHFHGYINVLGPHLFFFFSPSFSHIRKKTVAPSYRETRGTFSLKGLPSLMSNYPLLTFFFLNPGSHVSTARRRYCTVFFSEIKMQYELPKLGLRKTTIKVWSCLNSLRTYKWRRSSSLKNGWVSDMLPPLHPPGLHSHLFLPS